MNKATYHYGKSIRAIRKAHNMTVKQLAQSVGCSEKTIYNHEASPTRPNGDVATKIMAQLRMCKVDATERRERKLEELQPPLNRTTTQAPKLSHAWKMRLSFLLGFAITPALLYVVVWAISQSS